MVFKFNKSVSSTSYAAWYAQMKVFKFIAMLVMSYAAYYARMDLLQVYYDVSYASLRRLEPSTETTFFNF